MYLKQQRFNESDLPIDMTASLCKPSGLQSNIQMLTFILKNAAKKEQRAVKAQGECYTGRASTASVTSCCLIHF